MKDRKQLEIDFLNKSKSIYNNLFNYDKVIYVNNHTPITLICNKCGKEFTQRPDSHINASAAEDMKSLSLTSRARSLKAMLYQR